MLSNHQRHYATQVPPSTGLYACLLNLVSFPQLLWDKYTSPTTTKEECPCGFPPSLWPLLLDGTIRWHPQFRLPAAAKKPTFDFKGYPASVIRLFPDSDPLDLPEKKEHKDELGKLLSERKSKKAKCDHVQGKANSDEDLMSTCKHCPGFTRFTYIELFAGIGGFRTGMDALGGKCVFANEISPSAVKAYATNHGESPDSRNITDLSPSDIPAHDILTAGFPCQPFTTIGRITL